MPLAIRLLLQHATKITHLEDVSTARALYRRNNGNEPEGISRELRPIGNKIHREFIATCSNELEKMSYRDE